MLSNQEDQAERRRVFENDRKVREQQREQEERRRVFAPDQSLPNPGTTFHARAQADAAMPRGRFSAVEAATVVGANPTIEYPAASAAHQIQLPDEPPLSAWDNPALEEPSTGLLSSPVEQTGPMSDAPSTPLGQRDVGPSFSQLKRRKL
jgi:hypothetical protein